MVGTSELKVDTFGRGEDTSPAAEPKCAWAGPGQCGTGQQPGPGRRDQPLSTSSANRTFPAADPWAANPITSFRSCSRSASMHSRHDTQVTPARVCCGHGTTLNPPAPA